MPFALTDEQRRQIDADHHRPAQAIDPSTDRRYVLLPIEDYEALRDEREQSDLRNASIRTLDKRLVQCGRG